MDKIVGIKTLIDLEHLLSGKSYEASSDVCGIYYVSEPTEFILLDPDKLRQFRKAPELTTSLILNDIKLLELINNSFIPVIDKNTREVLFTEDEYLQCRKKMIIDKKINV